MQRRAELQMPNIRQALQRMSLSDEQRAEIRSIYRQYADEGQTIRDEISASRKAVQAAQQASPKDPAAIKTAREALESRVKKMGVLQAEVRTSVFNVLSIEQEEDLYRRVEILRKREEARAADKANP